MVVEIFKGRKGGLNVRFPNFLKECSKIHYKIQICIFWTKANPSQVTEPKSAHHIDSSRICRQCALCTIMFETVSKYLSLLITTSKLHCSIKVSKFPEYHPTALRLPPCSAKPRARAGNF